ncbi:MAG: 3-dehydroquinate synthase [Rhodobacteraceae bacterium]|nr:3-dehydroquinate synthase [Paracoccaceae bacterium]
MEETVIRVEPGGGSYDIRIGFGLLARVGEQIKPLLTRPRAAVITDTTVARLHLSSLEATLAKAGIDTPVFTVPAGEASKSWGELRNITGWMLDQRLERSDVVLAFGGGVVGDLVGFAAAILRRGVRYVQIPTTLLAQVDSAIGGKTGINTESGKNLVGAFHQPSLVLSDISLLSSLPRRVFLSGYSEIVKYGLIRDAAFFEWLETMGAEFGADRPDAVASAIRRSCEIKGQLVMADQYEHGERSLLNLGHTFGHALEAYAGYSDRLMHGEAVAIGCCLAYRLSAKLGLCSEQDAVRVKRHFQAMNMRTEIAEIPAPQPDPEELLQHMRQDKKVTDGRLRFVLPRGIGDAVLTQNVEAEEVTALLSASIRG